MKRINKRILLTTLILTIGIISVKSKAQQGENSDKTGSPYFHIAGNNDNADDFPLKSTKVTAHISGVIADVEVVQEYANYGNQTLEAIYVFPGSTRAAVYAMNMKIGDRIVEAEIKEKQKAREEYEKAVNEGRTASLLEQERPNVFQMNVGNILPGDTVVVILKYTELIIPDEGIYQFVYPTVVGPRYTGNSGSGSNEKWTANPYLHEGEKPQTNFDINVVIDAGMPIQEASCKSHETYLNYLGKNSVFVSLKNNQVFQGNKDYILNYRLRGNKIESGLLLYKGKEENFFLAMVQPPQRINPDMIPPREYVFIVDVSGSMYGFPLDISKVLMKKMLQGLNPTDRFNILFFAGGSSVLSENSLPVTKDNINKAINMMNNQNGGGGTELLPALKRAFALNKSDDYSRTFVILTDGYVSVEKEAFDIVSDNLGTANVFSFGIGTSVNRYIIEGIAHAGRGEAFVITSPSQEDVTDKFFMYVNKPVLTNIKVNFEGFDIYDVEPVQIPDLFAEKPILIYGKYKGSASGNIEITGQNGEGLFSKKIDIGSAKEDEKNQSLRYLWARHKLMQLSDYARISYSESYKDEIITVGLKYNLLTEYTSFVAIDKQIRNKDGKIITVKQPLPLPEGVSDYAVGGSKEKAQSLKSYNYAPVAVKPERKIRVQDDSNVLYEAFEYEEVSEEIEIQPEEMPEFNYNNVDFNTFIKQNIKYSEKLKSSNVFGIVIVSFFVNFDGTIDQIKIEKSVHPELDKEAIRVILLTNGKWKPAIKNRKPVKMKMTVPVKFEKV